MAGSICPSCSCLPPNAKPGPSPLLALPTIAPISVQPGPSAREPKGLRRARALLWGFPLGFKGCSSCQEADGNEGHNAIPHVPTRCKAQAEPQAKGTSGCTPAGPQTSSRHRNQNTKQPTPNPRAPLHAGSSSGAGGRATLCVFRSSPGLGVGARGCGGVCAGGDAARGGPAQSHAGARQRCGVPTVGRSQAPGGTMGSARHGKNKFPLRKRVLGAAGEKSWQRRVGWRKVLMHFAAGTEVVQRCLRAPTPHPGALQRNPPGAVCQGTAGSRLLPHAQKPLHLS